MLSQALVSVRLTSMNQHKLGTTYYNSIATMCSTSAKHLPRNLKQILGLGLDNNQGKICGLPIKNTSNRIATRNVG
jgi:hypothetical protein